MPVILLVRHGENEYVKKGRLAGRLPGVHLNENGRKQAQTLAEKLGAAPIAAIYSSPLERAVETAQPLAQVCGLEIALRPGLMEMDYGGWTDQKLKGLSRLKEWKLVQGAPSRFRFPEGERFGDAQQRIAADLEELAGLHTPKDLIVCVSHADPIKLAVAYFIGLPLDLFQRLHVSPASVTALALGEGGGHLLSLNYEFSFTLPVG